MSTEKEKNLVKETEKVKEPAKAKIKAPAKAQRLIYCGPNIPGGALQKYALFKGGTPSHLTELMERCPAIKELIIPVSELAKAEQAILTKGSRFNALYGDVSRFFRKGGV